MNIIQKYIYVFLILSFIYVKCDKLKQLHIIFRHGERTPTETYINDPYKNYNWTDGWGQLTNNGKLQIFTLGQHYRHTYNDFVPKYFSSDNLEVFSSYADRCLMSAELFTAGFYPPHDDQIWNLDLLWQPIPVSYVPRNQDNFIAMKQSCDKYDLIFEENKNSSEILEINDKYSELYKYCSEKTGMVIDNIGSVEMLYNTLEIEMLNNLTLPNWINSSLLNTMKDLAATNLASYSKTEFMKRMKGGVLLNRIINSMEKIQNQSKEPIIYLYSGHDLTIVHVLRSLNLIDTIKPDFGASIVIELHENFNVKVLYSNGWNQTAEEQFVCSKSPCPLATFKSHLESVLPTNWTEECEL